MRDSRDLLTDPTHVAPHVRVLDIDVEGDLDSSKLSKLELESRKAAIRSTAEAIINGPVMDDQFIEGLAKLAVPVSLLTVKMTELGEKAQRKGNPIGNVRYFAAPLKEYADWYQRRQETPSATSPSLKSPEGDLITKREHDAAIAGLKAQTSPETQRRIDVILALEPRPRWQAQWALHSAKLSPEAFDRNIERYRAECSAAS